MPFGFTNALLRPATENDRGLRPRFATRNKAVPALGRRGRTAQTRSVIVTLTATGVAEPLASAVARAPSAQNAPTATMAVGSRSLTILLIGRVRRADGPGVPQSGDLRRTQKTAVAVSNSGELRTNVKYSANRAAGHPLTEPTSRFGR
jgi:hypothetical protein